MHLMRIYWRMNLPKLLISVHGGIQKFEIQRSLKEALRRGFIKAAQSSGAWILTDGISNGVTDHIGDAIKEDASSHTVYTVGIAPWGVVEGRNDLLGQNVVVPYQALKNPLSKLHVLNCHHSHFILVDDGTVGKYGGEIHIRKELEKKIRQKLIHARTGTHIPLVAVIIEGGPNTLYTVLEYLQQSPPVPVIVCEGSGRAADLLAYVYEQTESCGSLPEDTESDVISAIRKAFSINHQEAAYLLQTLLACMRTKNFITVLRAGAEEHQDMDVAILTALLKGNNSPNDQLALALTWNRVDIAKNSIFMYGQRWRTEPLEQAMLDALIMDRVAFVKLLIENGVSVHKFLTIHRLEELYNAKQNASNTTLLYLIQDAKKGTLPAEYKITLMDVGLVVEALMGGTFRCDYTKKHFRTMYKSLQQRSPRNVAGYSSAHSGNTRHEHFIQTAQPYKPKDNRSSAELKKTVVIGENEDHTIKPFPYPFKELLVWAVLTNRQSMALFLWQYGEDFLAKALVARKLYLSMYHEARQSDIVDDTWQKLKANSKEFGKLALELLDKAYKQNETMAMKLLTYELSNWSRYTCVKLAVFGRLRTFVGHACTQTLLSDIWMGRLNLRKNSWYKVILCLCLPPFIPLLRYKTREQMAHIPQSQDAHQMIVEENKDVKYSEGGIAMDVIQEVKMSDGLQINFTHMRNEQKHLPFLQTFYAFYHAPIVKFWFNTFAYLGFLLLYSYVVLVEMKSMPSVQEWIVISVIFTTGLEKIYEIVLSDAGKMTHKLKLWFHSYMNITDTFGIITFLIGFGLRMSSAQVTNDSDPYENSMFIAGRLIYCLNIIFWFMRLLDFLNVNHQAGPYVLMIGKMITKMFSIIVIMTIVIFAFGVPRRGILYPREMPSWYTMKEVVFRPYWMTYGEMFAYEIDACANESVVPQLCGPGTWLVPFLQGVYLIFQYILLVNLLIALFNNVYVQGKEMSDVLWKFQRYHFVKLYQNKPTIPPPLSFISYMSAFIKWIFLQSRKNKSHEKKLYLTQEEQKTLRDFEELCLGLYFNDKKDFNKSNSEERIRVTAERVEQMGNRIKGVGDDVSIIKHSLRCLDYHIGHLQDLSGLTYDALNTLTAQKALASSRSQSIISCDLSSSRQTSDDGLERSTIGKRGRNRHVWSRSFSHPGPENAHNSRATKSQRKFNLSDTSPVHSDLFQKVGSLQEIQHGALCEDKNSCIYNRKLNSLTNRSRPEATQTSLQNLADNQRPDINTTKTSQGRHTLNQNTTSCSERASTFCLDFPEIDKNSGYVNSGFIDDVGHNIDFDENGSKYSENVLKPLVKQSDGTLTQLQGQNEPLENSTYEAEGMPKRPKKDDQSKRGTGAVNSFIRGKKLTGAVHKFFSKSKNTGKSDGAAKSYEDSQQSRSLKAALLKDSYCSRYSSSCSKLPMDKEFLKRFELRFIPSMDISFYYTSIERNNLYRLSQSIPFTPLPPVGELVTVYRLEESSPEIMNNSMASWSQQGYYAKIEFLGREEMGGGLRRALKVACAWCEYDLLREGQLYIIKSFLPEVVDTWADVYEEDTVLQLCLREIQQQRAAQKLLFAFNQMKPKTIPYSPRFLEVFLLYCHSADQWFTIEECMAGKFRKYNNNTGYENVPKNMLEKTMLAFSHWTYEYTKGEFLVLDLQGVGENLTDPCVITSGQGRSHGMIFGPANLGDDAIQNFCSKHECNTCCNNLKLPELQRNDSLQDDTYLSVNYPCDNILPGSKEEE